MFIRRDLAWLEGYPLPAARSAGACRWVAVPQGDPSSTLEIDRQRVQRSARTTGMLQREFPVAMPRLVGDVAAWAAPRKRLLDLIGRWVHGTQALPAADELVEAHGSRALAARWRSMREANPASSGLFDSFVWLTQASRDLSGLLDWAESQHRELACLGKYLGDEAPQVCVRLHRLEATHGPRRMAGLYRLIGQPELWEVATEFSVWDWRRWQKALTSGDRADLNRLEPPKPGLCAVIVDWVERAAALDRKGQRLGLELLNALAPAVDGRGWARFWVQAQKFDRRYCFALSQNRPTTRRERRFAQERLKPELAELKCRQPPQTGRRCLQHLLAVAADPGRRKLALRLVGSLEPWPDTHAGAAVRWSLADYIASAWERCAPEERPALLEGVRQLTKWVGLHGVADPRLKPFSPVFLTDPSGRYRVWALLEELAVTLNSAAQREKFFQVIEQVPVSPDDAQLLLSLLKEIDLSDFSGELFADLRSSELAERYVPTELFRLTSITRPADSGEFVAVAVGIARSVSTDGGRLEELEAQIEELNGLGLTDFARRVLAGSSPSRLLDLSLHLRLVDLAGVERPAPPAPNDPPDEWMQAYPAVLHPMLRELNRFSENPPRAAARILGSDFPDPALLGREIEHLEQRDGLTEPQRERLQNLRERLSSGTRDTLSPVRAQNLIEKLQRRADLERMDRWLQDLENRWKRCLVGSEVAPRWLGNRDYTAGLAATRVLPGWAREIAARAFASSERDGWDYLEDAENRCFLDRMQAAGIDCGPWLGRRPKGVTTDEGEYLISLEEDPLEVLLMGQRFRTCLSFSGCSFYSVFANIADANKRVLYVRDARGCVVGRMLLAITHAGGLLPFHFYTHGRVAGLKAAVTEYVHELATEMQTLVVGSGLVEPLVAPNWYDDGPVDLTRRLPCLEKGSWLRESLRNASPGEVPGLIEDALQPLVLNGLTAPWVLALPELRRRPENLRALLPRVRHLPLPPGTVVALVRACHDAGLLSPKDAVRWLIDTFEACAEGIGPRWPIDVVALCIEVDPAQGLRLLRRSRLLRGRDWEQDSDPWWLVLAADAHARLHRHKRALEILGRVGDRDHGLAEEIKAVRARCAGEMS